MGALRFDGVTDIRTVEFVDEKTNEVARLDGEKEKLEECRKFARIIGEGDWEAERLAQISKATTWISSNDVFPRGFRMDVVREIAGSRKMARKFHCLII